MKELKKWLETQESEYIDINDIAIEDAMAEKTWKAALEWVLKSARECDYSGTELTHISVSHIEQELQE